MSKRKHHTAPSCPVVSPETSRPADEPTVGLVRCPFCRQSSVDAESRLRVDVRAGVEFARHQCTNQDCRRVFVIKQPLAALK